MADYRKRVRDSHKFQAQAAGFDVTEDDPPDGDIVIVADNNFSDPPAKLPQAQPIPSSNGLGKVLGGAALAAALLGGGAGAGVLLSQLGRDKEPPKEAQQPAERTETRVFLR